MCVGFDGKQLIMLIMSYHYGNYGRKYEHVLICHNVCPFLADINVLNTYNSEIIVS